MSVTVVNAQRRKKSSAKRATGPQIHVSEAPLSVLGERAKMAKSIKQRRLGIAALMATACGLTTGAIPVPASAGLCASTTDCTLTLNTRNSSSGFGTGNFGTVHLGLETTTHVSNCYRGSSRRLFDYKHRFSRLIWVRRRTGKRFDNRQFQLSGL